MNQELPICYYPTQVVFVDDDKDYLDSLLLKFHHTNIMPFTSGDRALHYLQGKSAIATSQDDSRQVSADFGAIKQDTLADKSNQSASVVIVDYHMPEMTGLAFLDKTRALHCKKILVTGDDDYALAVDAFNRGLIDGYIRKGEPGFVEKITKMLTQLQWDYFTTLHHPLIESLEEPRLMQDPDFSQIFKRHLKENDIVSFCLLNAVGDFLLINAQGEQSYFVVRSREQLNKLALAAEEDGAEGAVVSSLRMGERMPFFGEGVDFWRVPGKDWGGYMRGANCSSESCWVWVLVDGPA
jgi:CheY-like chemotaxis protein